LLGTALGNTAAGLVASALFALCFLMAARRIRQASILAAEIAAPQTLHSTVADVARALISALHAQGSIAKTCSLILDEETPDRCKLWLERCEVSETEHFIDVFRQIMEPVGDQRWVMLYTPSHSVRNGARLLGHRVRAALPGGSWVVPVPALLAGGRARKGRARAFTPYWAMNVGAGTLVGKEDTQGRSISARLPRPLTRCLAYEVWR
jgi:hypothetical protein